MKNTPLFSLIIPTTGPKKELFLGRIFSRIKEERIKKKVEILLIENSNNRKYYCPSLISNFPELEIRYYKLKQKSASLARNYGIRKSRGKTLIFLDDDCIPRKSWFDSVEKLTPLPPDVIFQGRIVHRLEEGNIWVDVFNIVNAALDLERENRPGKLASFFYVGNVLVKKKTLEKLDYVFDEKLFPFVGEQEDLAYRLREKGIDIIYSPSLVVDHLKVKKTFSSSLKRSFLYGRRDVILTRKYHLFPKTDRLESLIGKGVIKKIEKEKKEKIVKKIRKKLSGRPVDYRIKFWASFYLMRASFKVGYLFGMAVYQFSRKK